MAGTAIFTLVQNDNTFTARWVQYHRRFFDCVYVLEHDTRGDGVEMLKGLADDLLILPTHHRYSYDADWMAQTVRQFHSFLSQSYDVVAFTAVDEFLVAPRGSLGDRLKAFQASEAWALRATGYEVVHDRDQEPPLDWAAASWLSQRHVWYSSTMYSKPVLGKRPIYWMPGFADASNVPQAADPGLFLVHLHRLDYDECLRKHREARVREWLPTARNEGPFRQNLIDEPDTLSRWMLCNSDDSANFAKLEEIPPYVRQTL